MCAPSEATTGLLWWARQTSLSPHVCHRAAQPHSATPDWEALQEPSSSPWEWTCLTPWEETWEITCHFKLLTANPHSLSHSGSCRVNSRREQLDMSMGGGGCSPKVCLASTVCDWLDWLSCLGLGRFKIPRSDCLARCNEPCRCMSALLRVYAATLKCPLSPFTDTVTQPCLVPAWDCILLAAVCLAFPKRPCKVFWRRWEQGWRWGRSSFLGFSWFGIRSQPSPPSHPPPRSPARPYALAAAAAFMTLCKETFKMLTAANSNLFSGKRSLPTRLALTTRRLWFSVVPKEC